MSVDDRFEELAETIGGFYRSWLIFVGVRLGLFARLDDAGKAGLSPEELAGATGCAIVPVEAWVRAAFASRLVDLRDGRAILGPGLAEVLLDDTRPEYLGGQFVMTVVASLDYDGLLDFFRTARPIPERPPRFHRAYEALTAQDIAVFFQEGLATMPTLTQHLADGGRVLDVACGGGRWLVAVARRFPNTHLVGVEFEPDSVDRARRLVTESELERRIRIDAHEIPTMAFDQPFDLVYFQDVLHELPDPVRSLRAAWQAVAPGGRLVVLDWCLPTHPDEARTLHGELLWGTNLDELYQGTRLLAADEFVALFERAGLPAATSVELPSGASIFYAERTADSASAIDTDLSR
jgi:SAM-dependent methyltransferase